MNRLVPETDRSPYGDDRVLVEAIAGRDEGALAEAYRRHGKQVSNLARQFCGYEHAEEVTQDIFLKLWTVPERFKPELGSLRTYLLAQSHGRAVDRLRSDTARRSREQITEWHSDQPPSVEQKVLTRLAGDRTVTLLAGLARGTRSAITLAYFGGYTYREVAAMTDQPEGTVKSRIRAGLAELRLQLVEYEPPRESPGYSLDMPEPLDDTAELADTLSQVARALFDAGGVEETLQAIVDLAPATIDGCDYAGIFVAEGDVVATAVYSDEIVVEVDDLQQMTGEGPCLDAIANNATFYGEDLMDDARWTSFGPQSVAIGVRCALAFSLVANDNPGALNLYSSYPSAFGATDRAKGAIFATLASLALSGAHTHEDEDRRADNLQVALSTRELIGQAQGILMEREHITSGEAFDILRRASQHLNVKLREVAQDLVDTGERPISERSGRSVTKEDRLM